MSRVSRRSWHGARVEVPIAVRAFRPVDTGGGEVHIDAQGRRRSGSWIHRRLISLGLHPHLGSELVGNRRHDRPVCDRADRPVSAWFGGRRCQRQLASKGPSRSGQHARAQELDSSRARGDRTPSPDGPPAARPAALLRRFVGLRVRRGHHRRAGLGDRQRRRLAFFGPQWWHDSAVGRFFNSLHFWAVQLFFVFMVLHLWGQYFMAGWRDGRAATWMIGAVIFLVSIVAAFTGYLSQQNFAPSGSPSTPRTPSTRPASELLQRPELRPDVRAARDAAARRGSRSSWSPTS